MEEIDELKAKLLDIELAIRQARNYLASLERKKARIQYEIDDELDAQGDSYAGCEPDCLL